MKPFADQGVINYWGKVLYFWHLKMGGEAVFGGGGKRRVGIGREAGVTVFCFCLHDFFPQINVYRTEDEMDSAKKRIGAFIAKTVSHHSCFIFGKGCKITLERSKRTNQSDERRHLNLNFRHGTVASRNFHWHLYSQIPADDIGSNSTFYIDTSTLSLNKDFEFHMFIRACQSNYTVSGTPQFAAVPLTPLAIFKSQTVFFGKIVNTTLISSRIV